MLTELKFNLKEITFFNIYKYPSNYWFLLAVDLRILHNYYIKTVSYLY